MYQPKSISVVAISSKENNKKLVNTTTKHNNQTIVTGRLLYFDECFLWLVCILKESEIEKTERFFSSKDFAHHIFFLLVDLFAQHPAQALG